MSPGEAISGEAYEAFALNLREAADQNAPAADRAPGRAAALGVGALTLLIVFCSLVEMDLRFGGNPPAFAQQIDRFAEPLHLVSGYGLYYTGDERLRAAISVSHWLIGLAALAALVTHIVLPQIFCDTPDGIERVWAMACQQMAWHLQILERRLAKQPWVRTESSAIDWYVEWIVSQISAAGFDAKPFPRLVEHSARACAQPASQRAHAREAEAGQWLAKNGFPAGPPPRPGSTG